MRLLAIVLCLGLAASLPTVPYQEQDRTDQEPDIDIGTMFDLLGLSPCDDALSGGCEDPLAADGVVSASSSSSESSSSESAQTSQTSYFISTGEDDIVEITVSQADEYGLECLPAVELTESADIIIENSIDESVDDADKEATSSTVSVGDGGSSSSTSGGAGSSAASAGGATSSSAASGGAAASSAASGGASSSSAASGGDGKVGGGASSSAASEGAASSSAASGGAASSSAASGGGEDVGGAASSSAASGGAASSSAASGGDGKVGGAASSSAASEGAASSSAASGGASSSSAASGGDGKVGGGASSSAASGGAASSSAASEEAASSSAASGGAASSSAASGAGEGVGGGASSSAASGGAASSSAASGGAASSSAASGGEEGSAASSAASGGAASSSAAGEGGAASSAAAGGSAASSATGGGASSAVTTDDSESDESYESHEDLTQDCVCVPYYLCKDGDIITDGEGLIDIRFGPTSGSEEESKSNSQCDNFLDVCCTSPLSEPDPVITEELNQYEYVPSCGHRNPHGVSVVLDGFKEGESQFGEFPWMAIVLEDEELEYGAVIQRYVCGASLIHEQVIMTGAHCVNGKDVSKLRVRLGDWDTKHEKEIFPHEEHRVSKIASHERFNRRVLFNDVALLFLEEPVELKQHIDTLCLPEEDEDFDHASCVATGFGKDRFSGGTFQNIMKQVDLKVVPHKACQTKLRTTRLGRWFKLHDSFTCAGGQEGVDTCRGDGGSPLACPSKADPNKYVQAGIVAWGIGCGEGGVPGVYASVPKLIGWVNDKIGEFFNPPPPRALYSPPV
ncbi:putative lysozyme-like protein [Pollicipes pollicipes]|uniref:putative lysozyme-like protein n=1 Tax=Pollicipes pollicipes TaxID=41117 RepID=UPI001884A2FE|nr:putative lysozyme-like protein [Pollicipes pollicipes]